MPKPPQSGAGKPPVATKFSCSCSHCMGRKHSIVHIVNGSGGLMAASSVEKLFAFVLMPFDKKFDDLYRLGIKDVAAKGDVIAEPR